MGIFSNQIGKMSSRIQLSKWECTKRVIDIFLPFGECFPLNDESKLSICKASLFGKWFKFDWIHICFWNWWNFGNVTQIEQICANLVQFPWKIVFTLGTSLPNQTWIPVATCRPADPAVTWKNLALGF